MVVKEVCNYNINVRIIDKHHHHNFEITRNEAVLLVYKFVFIFKEYH